MKKYIFLLLITPFLSCADDDTTVEVFPARFYLTFDLLTTDGSLPENDNVQFSSLLIMENGELVSINNSEISWFSLGKIERIQQELEKTLYGMACTHQLCDEEYIEIIYGTSQEGNPNQESNDVYYNIIKYSNQRKDTLMVNIQRFVDPYSVHVTVEINNVEQQLYNVKDGMNTEDSFNSYIKLRE